MYQFLLLSKKLPENLVASNSDSFLLTLWVGWVVVPLVLPACSLVPAFNWQDDWVLGWWGLSFLWSFFLVFFSAWQFHGNISRGLIVDVIGP